MSITLLYCHTTHTRGGGGFQHKVFSSIILNKRIRKSATQRREGASCIAFVCGEGFTWHTWRKWLKSGVVFDRRAGKIENTTSWNERAALLGFSQLVSVFQSRLLADLFRQLQQRETVTDCSVKIHNNKFDIENIKGGFPVLQSS